MTTDAIDFAAETSLVAMFRRQAARFGDRPFLWHKPQGEAYRSQSWAEAARRVDALAAGLVAHGLRPGERVAIVAENRPEWCVADLAIMAAGGITVPVYTTNTAADHLHVLGDAGVAMVVVSTARLARRLLPACAGMATPPRLVVLIDAEREPLQNPDLTLTTWAEVMARGESAAPPAAGLGLTRRDTACLIYTSGTGGAPRGVALSHGAILHNCAGAYEVLASLGLKDEVFLSFLPLSHAYEHTAGQFFPLSIGAQIYYAEGIEQLAANMAEARPTIMTAVPRLYEVLREKILRGVQRAGGAKEAWFHRALTLGRRKLAGEDLGFLDRLLDRLCDLLVRRKVAARFGGRLKAFVSGGAPLNPEVGGFFTALGLRIVQGYGQTEAGPVIAVNPLLASRLHTVGKPLRGVDLRLAGDGEICVRGELVMQGYWNQPEATAQVIDAEGWLHTGDIGTVDADGYLIITDRKKDIIVNSGGDNISPQRVEGFLTLDPAIAQAMVYGDRKPHLVALVVPDPEWTKAWATAAGLDPDLRGLADEENFRHAVGEAVMRVNRTLSNLEKIRHFAIASEPFSTENGMLTPSMKIRRHIIRERYGTMMEDLYQ